MCTVLYATIFPSGKLAAALTFDLAAIEPAHFGVYDAQPMKALAYLAGGELMGWSSGPQLLLPLTLAVRQLRDPVFKGVLLCSLGWSLACFLLLYSVTAWAVDYLLEFHGWSAWATNVTGAIGALLLAFWLFLPVAAAIGTVYIDRIAWAVDRVFYPWLPVPKSASILDQVLDGVSVGLRVLVLNIGAVALTFLVPGLGFILGWVIAGYAIGRGLFVAIAMRRMSRNIAESLYARCRGTVIMHGALLALAAYVPIMNLFVAIIGPAVMVHVLNMQLALSPAHDQARSQCGFVKK